MTDPTTALAAALKEAIGHADEDTGIEHWHHASGGRNIPTERAGVFVDRSEVLAVIDLIFAAHREESFAAVGYTLVKDEELERLRTALGRIVEMHEAGAISQQVWQYAWEEARAALTTPESSR